MRSYSNLSCFGEKNSEEGEGESKGSGEDTTRLKKKRFRDQFRGMRSVTIYYHWYKNLNVNRMGFMGFRDNEKFLIKLD